MSVLFALCCGVLCGFVGCLCCFLVWVCAIGRVVVFVFCILVFGVSILCLSCFYFMAWCNV